MRFCDRCGGSLPKTQKSIHDRHGRWMCQPCHEAALREHKEKAQAHLREAHTRTGVPARSLLMPLVVLVLVSGIGAYLWILRTKQAAASTMTEQAWIDFYRAHHPRLAQELEGLNTAGRDAWEEAELARLASVDSTDPRASQLNDALKQELRTWRALFPAHCVAFDGSNWSVIVRRDWHGLDRDARIEAVADIDRVVSALVGDKEPWVLRDAGLQVGGRKAGEGTWLRNSELALEAHAGG